MTAAALTPSIEYAEDGVSLAFAAPFRFLAAAHLVVERIAASGAVTVLALGAGYAVTGGATDAGGTVTLVASVAGARLRIRRVTPRSQQDDYTTGDTFPAESHEAALDRLTLIAQELAVDTAALSARAILVPDGETGGVLGGATVRADTVLGFDGAGDPALYDTASFKGDKGDAGGNVESVGLFTESWAGVPAGTHRVRSNGHTVTGLGVADYIEDSLATLALAGAHPNFVKTVGLRYFRLLPDALGFITPEQGGCPAYVAGVNVLPKVQAALDYCKAVGAAGLKFPQRKYELWNGLHTGGEINNYFNDTGDYLTIDEWSCSLISTNSHDTVFDCKGPTGGNKLADYQIINSATYGGDVIWRGAGIKMCASISPYAPPPANSQFSDLYMEGITFYTGITAALNADWPCHPPSRTPGRENAWDITNKGIWCQNDLLVGNITIIRGGFDGFLGEHVYCGGGVYTTQVLKLRDYVSKNTNGSSINPNGPKEVDVDGMYSENVVGVIEGWSGWDHSRLINLYGKNCTGVGEFKGGYTYDATLRPDGGQPITVVRGTFENCGHVMLGAYCHADLDLIDTHVRVYGQSATMQVKNIDATIRLQVHKQDLTAAIYFIGNAGGPNLVCDNRIRIHISRTKEAVAAGYECNSLLQCINTVGPRNFVEVSGYIFSGLQSGYTPVDNRVAIIDKGIEKDAALFGAYGAYDPTVTASPLLYDMIVNFGTFSGAAGVYPCNLPAPATAPAFPEGAELFLQHKDGAKVSHFIEVINNDGTKLALVGYRDRIRLRADRLNNRWEILDAPPFRTASAAVNIASTALAAEAGPYTIAAAGLRPYHSFEVLPASTLGGFALQAARAETDQVKLWFKNFDGTNPEDPAAQNMTVRWGIRA